MKLIYICLVALTFAQDSDQITIEEPTTITLDETFDGDAVKVATDSDFDDQPTRIDNGYSDSQIYTVEYQGRQYEISVDGSISLIKAGQTTSFLQTPTEFIETKNFIRDDLPTGFVYLLVTSFTEESASGKVTVYFRGSTSEPYDIVVGLNKPTGICADEDNQFLYVADSGSGKVYQFEYKQTYSGLELKSDNFVVVYNGDEPYECSVDDYGNVYVADKAKNEIYLLYASDLYLGTSDSGYTAFSGLYLTSVSSPAALEVNDNFIYWVNSENGQKSGTLIKSNLDEKSSSTQTIDSNYDSAWGVTANSYGIYYSTDKEVLIYREKSNESVSMMSGLNQARGLCIGENELYVVDNGDGKVYLISQYGEVDKYISTFAILQGAYNIFCANNALGLAMGILALIFN
ncbi:unnamed protein product [Blepharisma stoltei]|uniref:Uncharacterized protein n=1 Tax=Blepharisma stoltei TaxID=1481888 RepID=A0AAU9JPJ0_9CILI|nr:unnamed protein product [Blepharisma stoltei]